MTELQRSLFELQDLKYRDFQSKLLPKTEKEKIIGVRTPILRKFAKEFAQTKEAQKNISETQQKKILEKIQALGDDIKNYPIFQDWMDDAALK